MKTLEIFEIEVITPDDAIYPGKEIQGRLIVKLVEAKTVIGIQVHCLGEGKVSWVECDDECYEQGEIYHRACTTVFGKDPSNTDTSVLQLGNHEFHFRFLLPDKIPGSFGSKVDDSPACYVSYLLQAAIYRYRKNDTFTSKQFIVRCSPLDLNNYWRYSRKPVCAASSYQTTVGCCCHITEPVTATFTIDKNGYVPGESILCTVEINEGSGKGISFSEILLLMVVTGRSEYGPRAPLETTMESKTCARLTHGAVIPGGSDVYTERLIVPDVIPSFLTGCSFIDIGYVVEAQAMKIEAVSELERLTSAREAELKFVREQNEMELSKSRETADIETSKFKNMVDAIGASTLQVIASAGPELQVKMLGALGLQSTIITDGSSPINLFNTAHGLIGGAGPMLPAKRSRKTEDDEDDD